VLRVDREPVDTAGADAARRATVASLRDRLARLGGLAGPVAPRPAHAPPRDGAGRAPERPVPRQPGFEPEQTARGTAWVRRIEVDLLPLLEAAGVAGAADAGELAALVLPPHAAAGGGVAAPAGAPIAVLDIESLGLRGSGVTAFLVGVGLQRGATVEVHQLLLADPGDEPALLTALLDRLDGSALLVTYNGRTFDVPTLRARCIVNRLDDRGLDAALHCDLLGPVRRLFRDRLGACTLRQAEVGLLAMERVDDVPGFEAPARYRHWLRGGGSDVLAGVVRHNELDVVATAVLGARLVAHVQGRMVEPVHPADCYRLALHLERQGPCERSEHLLRLAAGSRAAPWDRRAAHRLAARLRRRQGAGCTEALAIWRSLWRGDPTDLRGARALAIALERSGQLDEALAVSLSALRHCAALPSWRHAALRGAPAGGWHSDWDRRVERLTRRTARAAQLALRTA